MDTVRNLTAILVLSIAGVAKAASSDCGSDFRDLSTAQLSAHCAVRNQVNCTVVDSGVVTGSEPFGMLRYQLMHFDDADKSAAVVLSAGVNGKLHPFICSEMEAAYYENPDRPQIIVSRYESLLALPPVEQGTGGPQGALLYRWVGQWRAIDLDGWQKSFARRIAPRYTGWRGVAYDFHSMTGESFLYAPRDAHSSPSGFAKMRFVIDNGALRLTRLSVGSSKPVFDAMCRATPHCHSTS